jgi:hypothetical protein
MKKCIFILIVFLSQIIMACSREGLSGDKPPVVFIKIDNEKYQTTLGSYCWANTCADTAGPVELLKGKEPIRINAGQEVSIKMDYEPKPNKIHLIQVDEKNEKEVLAEESSFSAPTKKGIYYYSYGVWWMDEKDEHLSHGDAFYAFVLEVK